MHDRRLDGDTLVFGNQGALYKHAMTWFDLQTESIWSQVWGSAIAGPLKGEALTLLPAEMAPWEAWLAAHPGTTVLAGDLGDDRRYGREGARDNFVIGVAIGEAAVGYRYPAAAGASVVNDHVGERPIVVFVNPESRAIKVYLRTIPGADMPPLSFRAVEGGYLTDSQTGSTWDPVHGLAVAGPLEGEFLQQVPYVTSFAWAWEGFFPRTRFWNG